MTRKILKCGYLFVAPDWDFSNPIYRSKRWQRRWFVLFDDGELTYAVDDHIETVPQGIVDVTKAVEICSAETTTGHPFSLCIAENERRTFVKGTFPEEIKWWLNELRTFAKPKVKSYEIFSCLPLIYLNLFLLLKDRLRKDTFNRDKRTSLYFQHAPPTNTYGDVVDFGKL